MVNAGLGPDGGRTGPLSEGVSETRPQDRENPDVCACGQSGSSASRDASRDPCTRCSLSLCVQSPSCDIRISGSFFYLLGKRLNHSIP